MNQRDGMVSFHDNPEKYNSVGMLAKLDEEVITLLYEFAVCSICCLDSGLLPAVVSKLLRISPFLCDFDFDII